MLLKDAALLLGLSVNGMRSRAKADPSGYGLTHDNAGRLWLDFEPSKLPASKVTIRRAKPSKGDAVEPSTETRLAVLEVQLQAALQTLGRVEVERDHWRRMAETLAAKRRRFWPF